MKRRDRPASPVALAYGSVALCASLWGLGGVAAKAVFSSGIPPQALLTLRLWGASLLFVLILRRRLWPAPSSAAALLALGATMAAVQFTFYATINLLGVATAIFLQYTGPAMIALYLWLRGERPNWWAVGVATAGCLLLVGDGMRLSSLGLAYGLASAALLGVTNVLTRERVARGDDPWALVAWSMAIAALMWSFVVPPWRAVGEVPGAGVWVLAAAITVFATVLPFGIFSAALRTLDAGRASVVAMLEPVVGAIGAWLLLGEGMLPGQLAGGALILSAVGILQAEGRRRKGAAQA
ncbi:MAG TPA: EamA family transporter [Bacillota bacterium]|nr:EamA family transporter [Bacillota bacterium]